MMKFIFHKPILHRKKNVTTLEITMGILFYIFFTFFSNKHKSFNCICNWYSKILNMSIVILYIVLFLSLHSSHCFNTCALRESHFRGLSWSVGSLLQGWERVYRALIFVLPLTSWTSTCHKFLYKRCSLPLDFPSAASGKVIVHRLSGNTGHFIFLCVWVM